jgi:pimeloyl-ACP methyl ester carboxylesterase
MTTWVQDGAIELDGRTWAVRQSGVPDGRPLVYFHGTPSSRLEPAFADQTAATLGVRIVSFDRPGYGGSSPARFSLASVAADTGRIADALGIDRFATTGQSGGGPFSLACAAVLGERVTRAGVTSGAGPFAEVPELMDELDDNDTAAVALLPDQVASARQFAVGFEPFRGLGAADDATIVDGFRQMCSSHDGVLLDDPGIAGALVAGMRISLAQGCEGAGWDNVAWVGPWDVDLDDVRRPVHLWYGDDDPFCPALVGPWLAAHLPEATLVLREGEGHLGVMEHLEEVLVTLTGD